MIKNLLSPIHLLCIRVALACFLLGGVATSCNSDSGTKKIKKLDTKDEENVDGDDDADDNGKDKKKKKVVDVDDEDVTDADDNNDNGGKSEDDKIAREVCNCFTDAEDGMSDEAKNIMIKAAKTNDPAQTAQRLIQESDNQQEVALEVQKMQSAFRGQCLGRIDDKYHLKGIDKTRTRQIIKALDNNCSEFVSTMMRIGMEKNIGGGEE